MSNKAIIMYSKEQDLGSASAFSESNPPSLEDEAEVGLLKLENIPDYLQFSKIWGKKEKMRVSKDITVTPNFITAEEESLLIREAISELGKVEFHRYEKHFADCGSRQTKMQFRTEPNATVITRAIERGFPSTGRSTPSVHVLELMDSGFVRPHIGCPRCNGDIIVGINMLSSSVMRLYCIYDPGKTVDVLLPARSMYKIEKSIRYAFTRTILPKQHYFFDEKLVERGRRISIILSCFLE